MLKPHLVCAVAGALIVGVLPARVAAEPSMVTGVVNTTPDAAAGATIVLQIGLTTGEARWEAGSYRIAAELDDERGARVAASESPGTEAIVAGRTTMVYVNLPVPADANGTYHATLSVEHAGAIAEHSDPVPIVIGGLHASGARAEAARLGGSLATTANFASSNSESGVLSVTGKYGAGQSFITTGALSTTPGGSRPVIGVQTATTLTQIGTFTPSIDPLALEGASGTGFSFRKSWGPVRALQLAYVSGGHATANPYTIEALSYAMPAIGGKLTLTTGLVHVDGPPTGIVADLDNGSFAALSFAHAPSGRSSLGYTLRYSLIRYDDKTGEARFDRALEAALAFKTGRVGWSIDLLRAGPYYPTITAPGISSDRQTERIAATIPIHGGLSATLAMNGYHDALPGSAAMQKTHFWTESLTLSQVLHNGDTLALNLVGATQHQAGPTDLASANDTSNLTYNAKRGPYTLQISLGGGNQRDTSGNLMHTTQDGVTVSRTLARGFSLSTGLNFTKNAASDPSATSSLAATNVTLGWTRGPVTLSGSIVNTRARPFFGPAPADTTGENLGLTLKLHKGTALQASLTNTRSATTATTGALNVTRQF